MVKQAVKSTDFLNPFRAGATVAVINPQQTTSSSSSLDAPVPATLQPIGMEDEESTIVSSPFGFSKLVHQLYLFHQQ